MIVVSNCLGTQPDEGCLKVAVQLIRRMKEKEPQTLVVGYERQSSLVDRFLPINKLMLSLPLIRILRSRKEPVLFAPFSAKLRSIAIQTFVLSLFARGQIIVLQPMYSEMTGIARFFMKRSGARLIALSACSQKAYSKSLGEKAIYLKTGVDTHCFAPCPPEKKISLRQKYGLPEGKPIVLHIGHMKPGRNIQVMTELSPEYHGVVVVSTHDPGGQDSALRDRLTAMENITLIQGYVEHIEEIYQLSDVYLFPVVEKKGCIDVPLSALEAAACGIPVVSTPFREMQALLNNPGFYEIREFSCLNDRIQQALTEKVSPRQGIYAYDWDRGAQEILSMGKHPCKMQET